MTLDEAQERFEATPNLETAKAWMKEALTYYEDGMISLEEVMGVVRQIAPDIVRGR